MKFVAISPKIRDTKTMIYLFVVFLIYSCGFGAFHLPTLGWRVETRGCFFISRVESRESTLDPPNAPNEEKGRRVESLGREFA